MKGMDMQAFFAEAARLKREHELIELDKDKRLIRSDAESAIERLQVIQRYLERGEALPPRYAAFLAKAIKDGVSGAGSVDRTRDDLLQTLGLKVLSKRPLSQSRRDDVGWAMVKLVIDGDSVNSAALAVALEFDVGETTAKRCFEEVSAKLVKDKEIGQ